MLKIYHLNFSKIAPYFISMFWIKCIISYQEIIFSSYVIYLPFVVYFYITTLKPLIKKYEVYTTWEKYNDIPGWRVEKLIYLLRHQLANPKIIIYKTKFKNNKGPAVFLPTVAIFLQFHLLNFKKFILLLLQILIITSWSLIVVSQT